MKGNKNMYVTLTKSGLKKQVKVGFSWTTFFFGLFVPLIRGDLKWAAIMFALSVLAGALSLGIGSFFVGIIFSFVYNKVYIKDLIERGWQPNNDEARDILQGRDIL